jgi:hypothetical protein
VRAQAPDRSGADAAAAALAAEASIEQQSKLASKPPCFMDASNDWNSSLFARGSGLSFVTQVERQLSAQTFPANWLRTITLRLSFPEIPFLSAMANAATCPCNFFLLVPDGGSLAMCR